MWRRDPWARDNMEKINGLCSVGKTKRTNEVKMQKVSNILIHILPPPAFSFLFAFLFSVCLFKYVLLAWMGDLSLFFLLSLFCCGLENWLVASLFLCSFRAPMHARRVNRWVTVMDGVTLFMLSFLSVSRWSRLMMPARCLCSIFLCGRVYAIPSLRGRAPSFLACFLVARYLHHPLVSSFVLSRSPPFCLPLPLFTSLFPIPLLVAASFSFLT